MILSISLDGYKFFFRMNVSDAMSSLNACQVLQILRVLSTRVLTSPILYENEVKLEKHVNKPVNVFLIAEYSSNYRGPRVVVQCIYLKRAVCDLIPLPL